MQDGARLDIVMNRFFRGEGQSMYLLIFVFSIHFLHVMLLVPCLPVIRSMKMSRREPMAKIVYSLYLENILSLPMDRRFKNLNMLHIPLRSCLQLRPGT